MCLDAIALRDAQSVLMCFNMRLGLGGLTHRIRRLTASLRFCASERADTCDAAQPPGSKRSDRHCW